MKIKIKMQKSSSVDLSITLRGIFNVTNIKVSGREMTCDIPREEVVPGGKIDTIFNALGGVSKVESITLTK